MNLWAIGIILYALLCLVGAILTTPDSDWDGGF